MSCDEHISNIDLFRDVFAGVYPAFNGGLTDLLGYFLLYEAIED